jgi:hypothetical protein
MMLTVIGGVAGKYAQGLKSQLWDPTPYIEDIVFSLPRCELFHGFSQASACRLRVML